MRGLLGSRSPAFAGSLHLGILLVVACNEPGPSPKASDCAKIAEQLASLEVGPQAKADVRAAAVIKHRASCDAAGLQPAEITCFATAKDTWSAMACAPRMFPQAGTAGIIDCKQVVERTRAAVTSEMPADSGSAGLAMVDKMMAVMQRACTEDAWPEPMRRCVMTTRVGDMKALQLCNETLPKELQDKLQQRLTQEMSR